MFLKKPKHQKQKNIGISVKICPVMHKHLV